MREPANKRMLTDVSGLRSYRCTITVSTPLRSSWRDRVLASPRLDTGHKSMRPEFFCRRDVCMANSLRDCGNAQHLPAIRVGEQAPGGQRRDPRREREAG